MVYFWFCSAIYF